MTQALSSPDDLLLAQYLASEAELEAQGVVPAGPQRSFRILGAIHLAFLIACLSLFLNFIVINMIFHIGS